STDCAIIPEKFSPVVFDSKLHLGMSRQEVITALGPPSKSEAAQIVYSHEGKLADGFDETAWLILRFREDQLVSLRGAKTTTTEIGCEQRSRFATDASESRSLPHDPHHILQLLHRHPPTGNWLCLYGSDVRTGSDSVILSSSRCFPLRPQADMPMGAP